MVKKVCIVLSLFLLLLSCSYVDERGQQIEKIVREWEGKTIIFPSNLKFISQGQEIPSLLDGNWDYAIVSYTDSTGCTSCKLQLDRWKDLIDRSDSIFGRNIIFLFVIHPLEREDLLRMLREYKFDYPICIDEDNLFDRQNDLPDDDLFRTFLLNKKRKVVAIGNPVYNPKIRDLYGDVIQNRKQSKIQSGKEELFTKVSISSFSLSLGGFPWQEPQSATLILTNTGTRPLVVQDVVTSCGCLTVDYPREPVRPGGEAALRLTYKADNLGYFRKTVTVYANAEEAPLRVQVSGNAE